MAIALYVFVSMLFQSSAAAYKAEWIRLEPKQFISPRRSGLVSILAPHLNTPLVFGGYAEDEDVDLDASPPSNYHRYTVNDLWQWKEKKWNKISPAPGGDIPAPRLVAAAACLGKHCYLFGGWNSDAIDPSQVFLDTVHELDLDSFRWKLLAAKLPDGPSSRHVAVTIDAERIILHTHRCLDFVYVWDGEAFLKQPTTGPCPSPRGLHAACHVADNQVIIFGGAAQDGTMSNEVFSLDTRTWEWTKLHISGKSPSPRAAPCLVCVDNYRMLLYGGAQYEVDGGLEANGDVWLLDLERLTWECLIPSTDSTAPPPRNAAALLPINQTGEFCGEFLPSGGWAPFRETWNDCHLLRITADNGTPSYT
jgi:hypothetical protein